MSAEKVNSIADKHKGLSATGLLIFAAVAAAIILFVTIFSYSTVANESDFFGLDSHTNIESNPHIQIEDLSISTLAKVMDPEFSRQPRRPLANLSFSLNYYFSGLNPVAYRWTNIVVLYICGLGVGLFAWTFMRPWYKPDLCTAIAIIAFASWTLHPIQTNITTYIVQRMTSLAIAGYTFSFVCFYLAGKRGLAWLFPAALFAIIALGSKEIAYMLPATLLLHRVAADDELRQRLLKHKTLLLSALALLAILLPLGAYTFLAENYGAREFTAWERLLTQFRVLWGYLGLYIIPSPGQMNLDYDIATSTGLLSPATTLISLLGHLAALAAAAKLWKNNRATSLLIVLYYLHHAPESSLLPLEMAFEHRMSLPGVFVSILFGKLVVDLLSRRLDDKKAVAFSLVLAMTIAFVFAPIVKARNQVWTSRLSLVEDMSAKSPGKPRVLFNLGFTYEQEGLAGKGLPLMERALEMEPDLLGGLSGMGTILAFRQRFQEALPYFYRAVELGRETAPVLKGIGYCLDHLGRTEEALPYYEKALSIMAGMPDIRLWMALAHGRMGRYDKALYFAREAVKFDPQNQRAAQIVRTLSQPR